MKIILKSQRLTLREFTANDAQLMYELDDDPDVIRYTGDQPFESLAQAESLVNNYDNTKSMATADGASYSTIPTNIWAGVGSATTSSHARPTLDSDFLENIGTMVAELNRQVLCLRME